MQIKPIQTNIQDTIFDLPPKNVSNCKQEGGVERLDSKQIKKPYKDKMIRSSKIQNKTHGKTIAKKGKNPMGELKCQ